MWFAAHTRTYRNLKKKWWLSSHCDINRKLNHETFWHSIIQPYVSNSIYTHCFVVCIYVGVYERYTICNGWKFVWFNYWYQLLHLFNSTMPNVALRLLCVTSIPVAMVSWSSVRCPVIYFNAFAFTIRIWVQKYFRKWCWQRAAISFCRWTSPWSSQCRIRCHCGPPDLGLKHIFVIETSN